MTIKLDFLKNSGEKYQAKTLKYVQIIEEEGELPTAILTLDRSEFNSIQEFRFCKIIQNEVPFFLGKITSRVIENDDFKITTVISIVSEPHKKKDFNNIIEKFKEENPELFTDLSVRDYTIKGEVFESDILTSYSPIDIENEIVPPLKIEQNEEIPISEVELKIKGSWISRREGNIGISTKIDNHFNMGKVNTLTPKKLLDSWPQFGEKFSGKSRTTKYYVSQSRLRENNVIPFPALKLNSEIPAINLNKYIFDNKLSIAWDYDQYMTETGTLKLKNNLIKKEFKRALGILDQLSLNLGHSIGIGNKKELYINLKNVQEYISNPSELSFFRSSNGQLILNEILKSIVNYVILSMRNLEISFKCLYSNKLKDISCRNWIIFKGEFYKITKIIRRINNECNEIFITAKGFGANFSIKNKLIPNLKFEKSEDLIIHAEDIIEDIVVRNDADQQYEKLIAYISSIKKDKKISLTNYKSLITKFLNDNQTEIQIITKPLKTEHCENRNLDFGEISIN